jgi:RNA polymerase sigma-70 factor, ECF subfamily
VIDQSTSGLDLLDEQQLIEAAKCDPDALSVLYRRHHAIIYRYVSHRVATKHDVHDIVSDVFLTMVRYLPRYRWTGAPFQSWLFRIATSQINRWVRKRKWIRFWAPFQDQFILDSSAQAESELVQRLRKALLELPGRYQDTLALFYLEDLSINSIAVILDIEPGTVKARLSRGRQLLRAKLESSEHKEIRNERRTITNVLERTQT